MIQAKGYRRLRKSWVFVLLLGFSRHLYAEVVFGQRVETWLFYTATPSNGWVAYPSESFWTI
jgi:hypothetical protein